MNWRTLQDGMRFGIWSRTRPGAAVVAPDGVVGAASIALRDGSGGGRSFDGGEEWPERARGNAGRAGRQYAEAPTRCAGDQGIALGSCLPCPEVVGVERWRVAWAFVPRPLAVEGGRSGRARRGNDCLFAWTGNSRGTPRDESAKLARGPDIRGAQRSGGQRGQRSDPGLFGDAKIFSTPENSIMPRGSARKC